MKIHTSPAISLFCIHMVSTYIIKNLVDKISYFKNHSLNIFKSFSCSLRLNAVQIHWHCSWQRAPYYAGPNLWPQPKDTPMARGGHKTGPRDPSLASSPRNSSRRWSPQMGRWNRPRSRPSCTGTSAQPGKTHWGIRPSSPRSPPGTPTPIPW